MFRNGFCSRTFRSIFSQLGKGMVWLMQVVLMILKFGFHYDDRHKGTICLQMRGD